MQLRSASLGNCSLALSSSLSRATGQQSMRARKRRGRGGGCSRAAVIAMGSGCVRTAGTSAGGSEMVPSELGQRCASADYESVSQDEASCGNSLSVLFHAHGGCRGRYSK